MRAKLESESNLKILCHSIERNNNLFICTYQSSISSNLYISTITQELLQLLNNNTTTTWNTYTNARLSRPRNNKQWSHKLVTDKTVCIDIICMHKERLHQT